MSPGSEVGGGLAALALTGLGHGHVEALQPLLGVPLVLGLEHVTPALREDLEGPGEAPVPPLLPHHLHTLHLAQLDGTLVGVVLLGHRGHSRGHLTHTSGVPGQLGAAWGWWKWGCGKWICS